MITDPRLLYGTTTAGPLDPLSPQGLLQQGAAQVPTGTVETEGQEQKVKGAGTAAADRKLIQSQQDMRGAMLAKKDQGVQLEGIDQQAAEAERDEAERKQQETDALIEKENAFRASVLARKRQELEDFKKTSTTKTLFDDMTPLRRFLSAITVGAGQWSATMSGSGKNSAYEIFKDKEDQYAKQQEAALRLQTEKMLAAGKNDDEVLKSFQRGHDLIGMGSLARLDVAKKQALALKAAVPQKAAEIDKAVAEIDKDYAEKLWTHENPYDPTKRSSTQTSSGDKSGAGAAANRKTESEQKLAMLGSSMKAELNAITKGPALTEKDLQGLQDNTLGSAAADKKAESGPWGAFVVGLGRWADMIPRNRYDSLSKEKKIVVNAWDNAIEKYARILTGAGMPAEESRRMSLQNAPVAGDDVNAQKFKFDRLVREADFMMALSDDAKAAIVKRLQEGETFDSLMPAQEAPQPTTPSTGKVGSPVKVKAIPPKIQDAAVAAVDDYSAIKAAMKAGKVKQTPNLMKAMGRLVRSHQSGGNDEAAAKYLRMLRERESI